MQIVEKKPARMLRCIKILGGIVAVLGKKIWTKTNPNSRTPARTSRVIMRLSFHCNRVQYPYQIIIFEIQAHRILQATPLQRQDQTDGARHNQRSAIKIQLRQLGLGREFRRLSIWDLQKKQYHHHSHSSQREIDVKAPSPTDLRSECSSQQRPNHRSKAKHGAEHALIQRAFVQRHSIHDDDDLGKKGLQVSQLSPG